MCFKKKRNFIKWAERFVWNKIIKNRSKRIFLKMKNIFFDTIVEQYNCSIIQLMGKPSIFKIKL